jgi:hypothetical protein
LGVFLGVLSEGWDNSCSYLLQEVDDQYASPFHQEKGNKKGLLGDTPGALFICSEMLRFRRF